MKAKKILLPESNTYKERTHSRKKKREEATELHRNSEGTFSAIFSNRQKNGPLLTDVRQQNEATGLAMIGLSAFSLSLIHYISSSGIPGLINSSMVYFGVGVYIAPAIVGLMGVQKFLEKPFQNIGWRVAGSIGTFIFSLGLFHTEGGKLGAWTYTSFATFFGAIPTKILFCSLLFSSAIFALDILYKDVLGALLVSLSLATKFLKFFWEVSINLIAMGIGAVKTTTKFCAVSYNRVIKSYNEKQISPESNLGKLLSFRPKFEESKEPENEIVKKESLSTQETSLPVPSLEQSPPNEDNNSKIEIDVEEEEALIIPVEMFNQGQESEELTTETTLQQNYNFAQIQVANIASECVFVNSSISMMAANSLPHPITQDENIGITETESNSIEESNSLSHFEETNESAKEAKIEISFKEEVDSEEKITEDIASKTVITTEEKVEQSRESEKNEAVEDNSKPAFVEKEQVFLEDNRIDHELKKAEQEAPRKIIKYSDSKLPPLEILKIPPVKISNADVQSELSYRSAHLLKTLGEFGIKATITDIVQGPAVSRFELKPAPGVKVRQITSLTDDIALSLAAQSIAIEAPIPGKSALGIIIPNTKPTPVYFYNLLKDDEFTKSTNLLQVAIGVTINGKNIYYNLAEMPHLLIAGSTGSGKSVCVNSIIASVLFRARADQVKFIMIDPKMVELSGYNGIPHLIAPVVTDPQKASGALLWAVEEMERRYELLSKCQGIKNIATYNEKLEKLRDVVDPRLEPMPYIVIVIDELADLMMTCSAEVEGSICRLTQMARAVGMHLIIATQRPSVNVITGLIKANLPSRIAFSVSSQVDSKTILDAAGAEKLLGKGDMLFLPKGLAKPKRLQGPYVSDGELNDLIDFVKSQGKPEYQNIAVARNKDDEDHDGDGNLDEDSDVSLIDSIKKYLENQEKTSTSMLQRKFRIGYNRAARIMDQLEEAGVVSPSDGSKQRRVLNGRSNAQI